MIKEKGERKMPTNVIGTCDFCNKDIFEKETLFAVTLIKEHLNNRVYEVDENEDLSLSCESCGKSHDFKSLVQNGLNKISQSIEAQEPSEQYSSFSNYECIICKQSIPNTDNVPLLTVNTGTEIHEGNVVTPSDVITIAEVCISCTDKYQIKSHVKQLIKNFIDENKSKE